MDANGYSQRFDEALDFAHRLHREQTRKGKDVPYINHLMGVASLVGSHGGDEDQVIAALLHDAVEDCVDEVSDVADQIRERFGERVWRIVDGCTDAYEHPKPPWQHRKRAYIDHLAGLPDDSPTLLVTLADKLHNARSIWRDYQQVGDELWQRFTGGYGGTLWYYTRLAELFVEKRPGPLAAELAAVVESIREQAGAPQLAEDPPTDNTLLARRLEEQLDDIAVYDALEFLLVEAPGHPHFLTEVDPLDLTAYVWLSILPHEPMTEDAFGTERAARFEQCADERLDQLRDAWASRGFEPGAEPKLQPPRRSTFGVATISLDQKLRARCDSLGELADLIEWLDERGTVFELKP